MLKLVGWIFVGKMRAILERDFKQDNGMEEAMKLKDMRSKNKMCG